MHDEAIDKLITESNSLFKQYILAHTALNLGQNTLSGFPDSVCITATVGLNIDIEPIPMGELKYYRAGLPHFLLEIFHGKLVQVWHECLSTLFRMLVDLHFAGKRQFKELKLRNISLDFRAPVALEEQIKERLCQDFDFQRYSDRVTLLNGVFNPNKEQSDHLINIAKHIQIRNSFQHNGGVVVEFLLKELGLQKIRLLCSDGKPREYQLNDMIELSVPEFDAFRRSLLMVGQVWRRWNG